MQWKSIKKQWFDIIEKLRQEHSFANSGWTEEQAQKLLNILDENAKTAKEILLYKEQCTTEE